MRRLPNRLVVLIVVVVAQTASAQDPRIDQCGEGDAAICHELVLENEEGAFQTVVMAESVAGWAAIACDAGISRSCTILGALQLLFEDGRLGSPEQALTRACDANEMDACATLGNLRALGLMVDLDLASALALVERACNGGEQSACLNLGINLRWGSPGFEHDPERAASLLERSCLTGMPVGCYQLAGMLLDGFGLPADLDRALLVLDGLCNDGFYDGCQFLAWMYIYGNAVDPDLSVAEFALSRGCEAGDQAACDNLRMLDQVDLFELLGATQTVERLQRVCSAGAATGCLELGLFYLSGGPVLPDMNRALYLFSVACDGGMTEGCHNLGAVRSNATTDAQRYAALAPLDTACRAGYSDACALLGNLFLSLEPRPTSQNMDTPVADHTEALAVACEAGVATGCSMLASLHLIPRWVPLDVERAFSLLELGCDLDSGEACFNLSELYGNHDLSQRDDSLRAAYRARACELEFDAACRD